MGDCDRRCVGARSAAGSATISASGHVATRDTCRTAFTAAADGRAHEATGSSASFVDLVTYYRNVLKQKGELVFDVPATHEFDVGKYREETMAFPPGVTVKDYESAISAGYPNPKPGGQPARFRSVLQFVPVTEK